jgi:hypothetical protein
MDIVFKGENVWAGMERKEVEGGIRTLILRLYLIGYIRHCNVAPISHCCPPIRALTNTILATGLAPSYRAAGQAIAIIFCN